MVHYGLWTTDGTPTHLNTITFMEANFLILAFEEECQREIKIIRDCLFQYRQFSYTTRVYSFVICNNLYHFFCVNIKIIAPNFIQILKLLQFDPI